MTRNSHINDSAGLGMTKCKDVFRRSDTCEDK